MMSPFKIFLKLTLQYVTDFENPKNQKGHVISDPFLKNGEECRDDACIVSTFVLVPYL